MTDLFIVLVLCFLGILLFLVEIFLIPGVTLAAVAGGIFGVGGIVYAYMNLGPTYGTITMVATILLFAIAFFWLVKSKALEKISLKTDIDSTVASNDSLQITVGDKGITLSRLNPIGKVKIGDMEMEAKTFGEFIDEDTEVVVVKVSKMQLIVKHTI